MRWERKGKCVGNGRGGKGRREQESLGDEIEEEGRVCG